MAYEADKRATLYGQSREMLEALEHKNEILADIAGVDYVSPGPIPRGVYAVQKRTLEAAQYANELLETIAESGGGGGGGSTDGGVLIVHATMEDDVATLDKTWQEIYDAAGSGVVTITLDDGDDSIAVLLFTSASKMSNGEHAGEYSVFAVDATDGNLIAFYADAKGDYPVMDVGGGDDNPAS